MLFLDKLWYESITLESHITGDQEYFRETTKLAELAESFDSMLSDRQMAVFENFSDQQLQVNAIGEKDAFVSGVRFGVKLLLDILCDADLRCL